MSRLSRFIHFYTDEDDGNGGEKGVLKTVSGTIIHILDALAKPAKKFVATLEPVQDLHGQDAPYPAGGGINKWGEGVGNPDVVGTYWGWYIPHSSAGRGLLLKVFDKNNGADVSGVYLGISENGADVPVLWVVQNGVVQQNGMISDINRHYISIYPKSQETLDKIFNRFNVMAVVDQQEFPDTYSPYSNLCPITGWTGANVVRTGKNLFNKANVISAYIDGSGRLLYNNDFKTIYVPLKPNITYTLKQTVSSKWSNRIAIINSLTDQGITYSPTTKVPGKVTNSDIYTLNFTNTDFKYLIVSNYRISVDGNNFDTIEDSCQLELGSTATTYEAFQGTTIPITFPAAAGTVYGGTLTNEDGEWKLRVEREKYVFTGNETWGYSSSSGSGGFFYTTASYASGYAKTGHELSENGVTISFNSSNNQLRVYLSQNSFLTQDSNINEYLPSGMGVLIELATPIEYTLTESQALTLLSGTNNVWCENSDSLELQYYAKAESTP